MSAITVKGMVLGVSESMFVLQNLEYIEKTLVVICHGYVINHDKQWSFQEKENSKMHCFW